MYDRRPWYIETLKIEQRKLSRNSNCYNFSLGCLIHVHHISRPLKLTRKLSANSNGHNFWLECMIDAHDISRCSKLNNGSSQDIQMAIKCHSDVRFTCIIYRDPRNWKRKLSRYTNGYKMSLGCPIHVHHISRPSKLKTEALGEFKRP